MATKTAPEAASDAHSINTRAARAMRSIYEGLKSGALICETEEAKRIVFFEGGYLVGARSDQKLERLGEVMVRVGRVSRAQLDEATRYIRSGRRLGQILVELGYLRGGEIEDYVRLQILEIASAIVVSRPQRLVFSDKLPVEAVTLAPIAISDVLLSAFKSLPDVSAERRTLVEDRILAQTIDALALAQGMKLSEEEAFLLDLVDGRLTVREILDRAPFDEEGALRVLLALKESGMVALREPSAAGRSAASGRSEEGARADAFEAELVRVFSDMQCQNHWQVLGVERGAAPDAIEKAYTDKLQRFDPAAHRDLRGPELHDKLSFVCTRFREAFETLSSKGSASAYKQLDQRESEYQVEKEKFEAVSSEEGAAPDAERAQDREEAKRLFVRAKRAYQEGDFWTTIELCRLAIELDDANVPERFYLLGKALSENPRWRRDAEKNLNIAHKLEPWEPRYLVALSKLYEREGLHARAKRVLEQVRTMDPDYGGSASEP